MPGPEFGYLQSRIQARHGQRLSDAQWQRLASASLLGSYLQSIRRTPMEPWVRRLTEHSSHHEIELSLRAHWRGYVAALAGWPLAGWAPAVARVAELSDLPAALALCRHDAMGSWVREDPVYADWWGAEGIHVDAIARHLGQDVVRACLEHADPLVVWRDHWRASWPSAAPQILTGMNRLIRLVEGHLLAMSVATDTLAGHGLRREFAERLVRMLRNFSRTPVAVFAHLGLVALEVEHLRAELLQRSLYAGGLA
jgi:hypothetical protein